MRRSLARELAIHIIYQLDLRLIASKDISDFCKTVYNHCMEKEYYLFEKTDEELKEADFAFTDNLVKITVENLDSIDDYISSGLKDWSLDRIANLEREILRVAITEFVYMDTPTSVAINEALKLTEKLSNEESKAYINAILGKISKDCGLEEKGRISKV